MIDPEPSYCESTHKWRVTESDEQGNTLDVYRFDTLSNALEYVADRLDAEAENNGFRSAEPRYAGEV